jgi:hypothetical protein
MSAFGQVKSEKEQADFVRAVIGARAEAIWLEKNWWRMAKEKYKLPADKNVFIDFDACEFYVNE